MNFREWLAINEEENRVWPGSEKYGANANNIDWDLVYPTTAGDYVGAVSNPKKFWWMQWEWERGAEIGRPLDNIDRGVLRRQYVSLNSKTAPDDQTWRHKPDKPLPIKSVLRKGISSGTCNVYNDRRHFPMHFREAYFQCLCRLPTNHVPLHRGFLG